MNETLAAVVSWATPPVLGALIGFVTNHIAIRMLFRPLTEKRILGIRVPFTPGIIPKQRRGLASSIGRMVSDELLTEDAVRAQVESPRVQEALRENIAGLTDSILGLRLEELREKKLPFFGATLPEILKGFLDGFFKSPVFLSTVEGIVAGFWDAVGGRRVREVAAELGLEKFLDQKIAQLIESEAVREKLAAGLAAWVRRQGGGKAPVAKGRRRKTPGGEHQADALVSDGLLTTAAALFRSLLPHVLDALRRWLDTPEVRREMEVKGKLLLDDILSKLNIFQRFFVSIGQYDATLSDRMPEIVDDFITRAHEAVRADGEREAIVTAFVQALASWRSRGFSDIIQAKDEDVEKKVRLFLDRAFDFLKKENLSRKIADAAGAFLVSRGEETLAATAENLFGLRREHLVAFVRERLGDDAFRNSAADKVTGFALDYFENRGRLTLGEVLGVDADKKTAFDKQAVTALNNVLSVKLPEALRSLDLRGLVENKINNLDIKAVEGLILMVIAKQLKWINVFGAILGGIIGLVQVLLRALGVW